MPEVVHALKNRWFVTFLPLITKEQVIKQYKGDWNLAAEDKGRRLDFVTTVEELWSTMNSLPSLHKIGVGSTYIFAREDKPTSYEAFPNGSRIVLKLLTPPASDKGLDIILASVLGELFPFLPDSTSPSQLAPGSSDSKEADKAEEGKGAELVDGDNSGESGASSSESAARFKTSVCDVIRFSGRYNKDYPKLIHVELWLNKKEFTEEFVTIIRGMFKEREIPESSYTVTTSLFEAPASSSAIKDES